MAHGHGATAAQRHFTSPPITALLRSRLGGGLMISVRCPEGLRPGVPLAGWRAEPPLICEWRGRTQRRSLALLSRVRGIDSRASDWGPSGSLAALLTLAVSIVQARPSRGGHVPRCASHGHTTLTREPGERHAEYSRAGAPTVAVVQLLPYFASRCSHFLVRSTHEEERPVKATASGVTGARRGRAAPSGVLREQRRNGAADAADAGAGGN